MCVCMHVCVLFHFFFLKQGNTIQNKKFGILQRDWQSGGRKVVFYVIVFVCVVGMCVGGLR